MWWCGSLMSIRRPGKHVTISLSFTLMLLNFRMACAKVSAVTTPVVKIFGSEAQKERINLCSIHQSACTSNEGGRRVSNLSMPSLQAWKSGSDIIKDPRRQSLSRPYCMYPSTA
jgi:acyl-coenzyme A synthetase/AMP-(fatty) acid ligase